MSNKDENKKSKQLIMNSEGNLIVVDGEDLDNNHVDNIQVYNVTATIGLIFAISGIGTIIYGFLLANSDWAQHDPAWTAGILMLSLSIGLILWAIGIIGFILLRTAHKWKIYLKQSLIAKIFNILIISSISGFATIFLAWFVVQLFG